MSSVNMDYDWSWCEKAIQFNRENESDSALDYHEIKIDLSKPISKEPLVAASDYDLASHSYYRRIDKLNPPYYKSFKHALDDVYLRKSVARRLRMVNAVLEPFRVEVFLLDCYRPIELQKELWEHFLIRARSVLNNPSVEEAIEYAGHFCSNPSGFDKDDWKTWPVHSTGGAVDLLLRSLETKEHLYFGGVFDDASELSYTDYFEKPELLSSSDFEARKNRRLLFWAMTSVGFANYPFEWWHYDLGTQMWVMNQDKDQNVDPEIIAYYGYVEPPK